MKNKKGFTLIELLVVIAIIGLLSTLAVVSLNGARSKARDARRTSDLKAMQSAMELYRGDSTTDAIPDSLANWAALTPALVNYLPAGAPTDPGSNYYTYCWFPLTGTATKYVIAATVENTSSKVGGLGVLTTGYNASDCIVSSGTTIVVPSCANTTVFCLGSL